LLQKFGAPMCFSMSASCSSRRAASKMPPELGAAPAQVVKASFEIVEVEGHGCLQSGLKPDSTIRLKPDSTKKDE
jgi:hypothetical protein